MELVQFTAELRKYFGITSCHIIVDNVDFMAMLMALNDDNIVINTVCGNLKEGMNITIFFPTLFDEKVELDAQVNEVKDENMIVVACTIRKKNKNQFFIEFQDYLNLILSQKKRKEMRILCTKKNLELLHLNTVFFLTFHMRQIKAVVKDISYSGIKILTNPLLLQEKGELFSFTLKFENPEEKFLFLECPIVRKNTFEFENTLFAEIVFKLPENIKYRKRLDCYFNAEKKQRSR